MAEKKQYIDDKSDHKTVDKGDKFAQLENVLGGSALPTMEPETQTETPQDGTLPVDAFLGPVDTVADSQDIPIPNEEIIQPTIEEEIEQLQDDIPVVDNEPGVDIGLDLDAMKKMGATVIKFPSGKLTHDVAESIVKKLQQARKSKADAIILQFDGDYRGGNIDYVPYIREQIALSSKPVVGLITKGGVNSAHADIFNACDTKVINPDTGIQLHRTHYPSLPSVVANVRSAVSTAWRSTKAKGVNPISHWWNTMSNKLYLGKEAKDAGYVDAVVSNADFAGYYQKNIMPKSKSVIGKIGRGVKSLLYRTITLSSN